jgi:hypothetical protein
MDVKIFKANLSLNGLNSNDLYKILDEKSKKEFVLSLINYRHDIIKTLDELFDLDSNKNKKFIMNLLVDVPNYLTQENLQSYSRALTNFLIESNIHTPKEKSKVVIAFINAGVNVDNQIMDTPLVHFVAGYCDVSAMKLFVQKKARLDIIDDEDDSVLSSTMIAKPNPQVLKYLLTQKGINYHEGTNIIAKALRYEHNEIMQVIIKSPIMNDEKFIEKTKGFCSVDKWNHFYSLYEKEKLEKIVDTSTVSTTKKMKI